MTLILPALAVAFAAFCVWLTVRIVNRREQWAKWTLAGVSLPALYVLSFGPACWATEAGLIDINQTGTIFLPIIRLSVRCAPVRQFARALASPGHRCEATVFRLLERPWPKPEHDVWLPDLKATLSPPNR